MKNSKEATPKLISDPIACDKCGRAFRQKFVFQHFCTECAGILEHEYEPEIPATLKELLAAETPSDAPNEQNYEAPPILEEHLQAQSYTFEITDEQKRRTHTVLHQVLPLLKVQKVSHVEMSLLALLLLREMLRDTMNNSAAPLVARMHLDTDVGFMISFDIKPIT